MRPLSRNLITRGLHRDKTTNTFTNLNTRVKRFVGMLPYYFLNGRHNSIIQPETPKSLGEPIGKVLNVKRNAIELENGHLLNNGDGLCFINKKEELEGFRLNTVQAQGNQKTAICFPDIMPEIEAGILIYRNQDQAFEKILNGKTADRRVGVKMIFSETANGFQLSIVSEDNETATLSFEYEKQIASKPENVEPNIRQQFSKLGNSIYELQHLEIKLENAWFFPAIGVERMAPAGN